MLSKIFHLHALSALHVGVGQAVGVVDLPTARSRSTNLPLVPGSGLKGVLRDEFADVAVCKTLFGPERIGGNDEAHAGALAVGDAHLLVLPVRSLAGVVAFVSCPFVLAQYAGDLRRAGAAGVPENLPTVKAEAALVCADSVLHLGSKIVLEDLDLDAAVGAEAWAKFVGSQVHGGDETWQTLFAERFVVVSDDVFSFLADTATEVRARIRIDDAKGTVERGALWYEENLPAEAVLWGVMGFGRARDGSGLDEAAVGAKFKEALGAERTLQIGGKATVGRGLVRLCA